MSAPAPVGILLVDKEPGITSHDVVARVRRALGTRKVGHAGTLDPMATGLLVVGVGAATKLLTFLVGLDKEYTATIRLGAATTTDDAEGETIATADAAALAAVDDARLAAGIARLTGDIAQRPSAVSAIRVDGRRAHERVRAGETVELPARPVTVSELEVLGMRRGADAIDIDVRVACSSGTYIRALARDLGEDLGVGGHLTALCRTRVGPFAVSDAVPVASWERDAPVDPALAARLLSPAAVAGTLYPTVRLDADAARDLADGKRIPIAGADGGPVAAVGPGDRLVGLVEIAAGRARVLMNLPVEPAQTRQDGVVIDWFVWVQVIVALLAGLLCVGVALAGRAPNDLTVFVLALVEVLLLAQVVIAIIAPLAGNPPTGDLLEFWVYLVTAVLIPPAATLWALVARSRWSTAILAAAAFAIAIMVWRMSQIWFVQVA